jgi:hypothetical protein
VLGEGPLPEVSAGPLTGELLQAAGVAAASHRSTIYLPRPPGTDQRSRAVLAHELVHVAHAGSEPRFFDDERRDGEEREAHQAERLAASASSGAALSQGAASPGEEAEATASAVDIDDLLDDITDRVLVAIERRGGRYRGVF